MARHITYHTLATLNSAFQANIGTKSDTQVMR